MRGLALVSAFLLVIAGAARADKESLALELNKLEANDQACRAYLVLENRVPRAFEALKLDLVMFDPDGVVAKRLALEVAPLPAGKTRLKVFNISGLPCERVGRMLLNDVLTCEDSAGVRDDCLALISTSARDGLSFIK